MRDTIEMAREAGFEIDCASLEWHKRIKAFEALVRADQDEQYKWSVHSCGPTCTKAACVATRKAVEAEREACAKVCDEVDKESQSQWPRRLATMIRARGTK